MLLVYASETYAFQSFQKALQAKDTVIELL